MFWYILGICPIMVNNWLASWDKFTNIFVSSIEIIYGGKKFNLFN